MSNTILERSVCGWSNRTSVPQWTTVIWCVQWWRRCVCACMCMSVLCIICVVYMYTVCCTWKCVVCVCCTHLCYAVFVVCSFYWPYITVHVCHIINFYVFDINCTQCTVFTQFVLHIKLCFTVVLLFEGFYFNLSLFL